MSEQAVVGGGGTGVKGLVSRCLEPSQPQRITSGLRGKEDYMSEQTVVEGGGEGLGGASRHDISWRSSSPKPLRMAVGLKLQPRAKR